MQDQIISGSDIAICTLAVRDAHESGAFGQEDCRALQSAYVLGRLLEAAHLHAEIFDDTAKTVFSKFFKLVQGGLAAPNIEELTDATRTLRIQGARTGPDRLDARFHGECKILSAGLVAHLLTEIQIDILDIAQRPRSADSDSDDANYVVGMLEITANDFGVLAQTAGEKTSGDFGAVDKFITDSCRFVSAVRRELRH